ncbi:patatin-like phospholipase family protein [Pseudomonas sp. 15FMM2]|uniref:Patatin-like phospholipase family protein n=1 Tax=Pseudomonas imrae TaxID=2992837 RepID=A0ACC7PD79_9PSED
MKIFAPSCAPLLDRHCSPDVNDVIGTGLATALRSATLPLVSDLVASRGYPQGSKTPLLEGVGDRKLDVSRYCNGVVELVVSPPAVSHLVLSGGGAKGIAFPGVVQALESKHALEGVQTIFGSSAGGISAALLASGMDAKGFDTLSDGIELPKLLNSDTPMVAWLQDASSSLGEVAGRLPDPVGRISQLLFTLLPRLQSGANPLEELVRNESRKAVLGHIAQSARETRCAETMAIADKLAAGGATTFGDLKVLSRHIPAIKELNITGTGMFDGRPQLVVFNADLTPDMDIAHAAHISGSLPILFSPPNEQGQPFQAATEKVAFQDGGLLLNTPARELFHRSFPDSRLSQTEQLIIDFESEAPPEPLVRAGFASSLTDRLTGVPCTAADELQRTRLKAYADQTVTLPLNSEKGDFRGALNGTLNFTMPAEVKNHLQELARRAVDTHLNERGAVREQHVFESLDDAVLAMDDTLLASALSKLESSGACNEVLRFRRDASRALHTLETAINRANATPPLAMTPELGRALRNLDALASRPEQVEWLGKKLNAADNRNFQQFLAFSAAQSTALSSVMTSALAEMKRRDIAVIADNFTREVIYPSLFRAGQSNGNIALLRRAEHNLARAATASQVNQVLDDIAEHYVARNRPWKQAQHSTTVEMARAWRLPVSP